LFEKQEYSQPSPIHTERIKTFQNRHKYMRRDFFKFQGGVLFCFLLQGLEHLFLGGNRFFPGPQIKLKEVISLKASTSSYLRKKFQ